MEFALNLIKDKDENIIKAIKMKYTFTIQTDKSLYRFKTACDNARGHRWHEVFIFDSYLIDKEILDACVIAKIIPYDMFSPCEYSYKKHIHYLSKE